LQTADFKKEKPQPMDEWKIMPRKKGAKKGGGGFSEKAAKISKQRRTGRGKKTGVETEDEEHESSLQVITDLP